MMNEFHALLELLGMLLSDPRTGALLALLALAAWHDARTMRIPNLLTGGGILFALAYSAFSPPYPHAGWLWAPGGMLIGFGAMLPMYVLRLMGAGDVKLMAMVGAFVGISGILPALLFSVVCAGFASLLFAARHGVTARLIGNVRELARGILWSALATGKPAVAPASVVSVGRMPLGVSIAAGSAIWLVASQLGFV